jgi:hypothetical protein
MISRTLGVDLASANANTAACIIEWDEGPPRVSHLLAREVAGATIVRLATEVEVSGIDSPFGWPRPFAGAIAAYASGAPWPRTRPEGLWLRRTDSRATEVMGGRAPLSVSSDRIARPAERAARLLTLLGTQGRAARRDGSDNVIEVYPAGALRCWKVPTDRYKRPDAVAGRTAIIDSLSTDLMLDLPPETRDALTYTEHATDAFVAALVARAFARGLVVPMTQEERAIALVEGWLYLPTGDVRDLN